MKVLWLCNVIIPQVCRELNMSEENSGGWLNQLADYLDQSNEVELCLCAPYMKGNELTQVNWGRNSSFYGFQKKIIAPHKYDSSLEAVFAEIIKRVTPDIVHIFGTEFPHTLAMVRAFNRPDRTVIHIQGMASVIAKHYEAFLEKQVVYGFTLRDVLRYDNIKWQKRKFEKRGIYEVEALKRVSHVMGRTDWDKACTAIINPKIQYHEVQEMMRAPFYEGKWELELCEKHSIFMSQGNYPIKGLHLALEAVALLKQKYDDVKLYVAGTNITHCNTMRDKLRRTYYAKYLADLIEKLSLQDTVVFTGPLNAEEMKQRYLSSHVFVSPSVIENSPNSVGEAMLLGVPIVASDVGGVSSLITHKKNGYLYQANAPYMLAYYVENIFEENEVAMCISEMEKEYSKKMYDFLKIVDVLVKTYKEICSNGNK